MTESDYYRAKEIRGELHNLRLISNILKNGTSVKISACIQEGINSEEYKYAVSESLCKKIIRSVEVENEELQNEFDRL